MKNYRFMIYPHLIKKSLIGIIINIYKKGKDLKDISAITKINQNTIEKYIKIYNEYNLDKFDPFYNQNLNVLDLIKLQKVWTEKYENKNKTKIMNIHKKNLINLGYKDLGDWLKNPNHIYIGRKVAYVDDTFSSKWRNVFASKKYGRDQCLNLYEDYIKKDNELLKDLHELENKTLGCWCKPKKCHGDILLKLIEEQNKKIDHSLYKV